MSNTAKFFLLTLVLSFVFIIAPSERESEASSWWNTSWKFRRKVKVFRTAQKFPTAPAVWVSFYCGGKMKPDGSDLRVTTRKGKLVNSTVKGMGPGDEVLAVFEALKDEDEYFVYYGNKTASKPGAYDPERGLLLETRKRGPGDPDSWAAMQRIVRMSTFVYGRGYVDKIFHGTNPFGPINDFISIYKGYVLAPKEGRYTFCTASDDASFLLIDGKLVCDWPGYHSAKAGLWGKHSGRVFLEKGAHKIEYYHLQQDDTTACVAGWKQPGQEDKDVALIPEWAFPGLLKGNIDPQEEYSSSSTADFTINVLMELEFEGFTFQHVSFSAKVLTSTEITSYQWDFGDGTTSDKMSPQHVYLEPGLYSISLKVTNKSGDVSRCTHKLPVFYIPQITDRAYLLDKQASLFMGLMGDHVLSKLPPNHLVGLWYFYELIENKGNLENLSRELLARLNEISVKYMADISEKLGDYLLKQSNQPEKALECFHILESSGSKTNEIKAKLRISEVYLFYLKDIEKAENYVSQVIALLGDSKSEQLRLAYVRMGDIGKFTGNLEKAQEWYARAEKILLSGKTSRQNLVLRGAYAQSVESYIRSGAYFQAFEYLDKWEWEFPLERLEGYSTYLRCQVFNKMKQYGKCVEEAETLVKVNPRSNYCDKLLFLAAESCFSAKENQKGKKLLRKIVEDYPASALIPQVKSLLAKYN